MFKATENDLFAHLLRILTPDTPVNTHAAVRPVLTVRNLLCVALSIYGYWLPWMGQAEMQDISEEARLSQLYGLGIFKGKSLCLSKDQATRFH